jgi:hypothetical protein
VSMSFEGYRTILMNPPREERGGGRIRRGAERHLSKTFSPWRQTHMKRRPDK